MKIFKPGIQKIKGPHKDLHKKREGMLMMPQGENYYNFKYPIGDLAKKAAMEKLATPS